MGTNARDLGPLAFAMAAELRAEVGRQNIGLRALADRAGMPHSTLSKSLNGLRMIDVEELAKICRALSLEPAELWKRATANMTAAAPVSDDDLDDVLREVEDARLANTRSDFDLAAEGRRDRTPGEFDDDEDGQNL